MANSLSVQEQIGREISRYGGVLPATQPSMIPAPGSDVASLLKTVQAVKQALDAMSGAAAVADRAVLVSDLLPPGATSLSLPTYSFSTGGGGGSGGGAIGYVDPRPILETPPTLTGFQAGGALRNIIVSWTRLDYQNHAYVQIWRGTTNALAAATLLGLSIADVYADSSAVSGPTYYYWGRAAAYRPSDGTIVFGAFNAVGGTAASLMPDPAVLKAALTNAITESELYPSLGSRISLIDAPETVAGSVSARVASSTSSLSAAIAAAGSNLLSNSSFDVDANHDGAASGWAVYNNTNSTQPATLTLQPGRQGGYCQRVAWSGTNTSSKGVVTAANVTEGGVTGGVRGGWQAGKTYVLSWWARASAGCFVTMSTAWSVQPAASVSLANPVLSATWQRYAFRVVIGSTMEDSGRFYITIQYGAAATGYLEIDDAQVTEGELLTGYAPGDQADIAAANVKTYAYAKVDGDALAGQVTTVSTRVNRVNNIRLNSQGFDAVVAGYGEAGLTKEDGTIAGTDGAMWSVQKVASGQIVSSATFNTLSGAPDGNTQAIAFANYVGAFPDQTTLIITTYDYPGLAHLPVGTIGAIHAQLKRLGASQATLDRIVGRSAYILVGILGMGEGTGIEKFAPPGPKCWINLQQQFVNSTPTGVAGAPAAVAAYAAVQQETSVRAAETGQLSAQWTVKLDVNGYVSGFGLASTSGTSAPSSAFIVRADRFAVSAPSGPGITPATPFIVQPTPTLVNGVTIPVGVYMDGAYIVNLTASIARLGDAWIDSAKIADAAIVTAKIGDAQITAAKIGSVSANSITTGTLLAARIAANSIDASKINARGLTIRDAAGNVILDAGGAGSMDWARLVSQPAGIYNSNITIREDGSLGGAGSGRVTLPGIGQHVYRVVAKGFSGSPSAPPGLYVDGARVPQTPAISYTVYCVRRSDGAVTYANAFNLYGGGSAQAASMAAALNSFGADYVVVVITDDEPAASRLGGGLPEAMYRCGASRAVFGSPSFAIRSAYVLIGVPGCGEGNGAEGYQGAFNNDPSAWVDMSFTLVSGVVSGVSNAYTPRTLADYSYTGDLDATKGAPAGTLIAGVASTTVAANAASGAAAYAAVIDNQTGLSARLSSNSRTVLSGGAGLSVGSLAWDGTGGSVSGVGVGINSRGIVGHDNTGPFFALSPAGVTVRGDISGSTGSFAGSVSVGGATYDNGVVGIYEGIDNGVARWRVGSSTEYIRWTGTQFEERRGGFAAAATPDYLHVYVPNYGVHSYGSITVSASGGTPPYYYSWYYQDATGMGSAYTLMVRAVSNVATFAGYGYQTADTGGFGSCIVTDYNGRSVAVSFSVQAQHGQAA